MMAHMGLHENLNTGPWTECALAMTKLENNIVKPHEEKITHETFYISFTDYVKHLKHLGEMGVVHIIISVKYNMYNQ